MRRFVPPRSTPMEKLLMMGASRVPSRICNFQLCATLVQESFFELLHKACSPLPEWVDGCASNAEDIAPDRRDPLSFLSLSACLKARPYTILSLPLKATLTWSVNWRLKIGNSISGILGSNGYCVRQLPHA